MSDWWSTTPQVNHSDNPSNGWWSGSASIDAPLISAPQPALPAQPSIMDKLTGANGTPRYQTFPERMVRGIGSSIADMVTLPHDVMQEATATPPTQVSDSDVGRLTAGSALNFALGASGVMRPPASIATEAAPTTAIPVAEAAPPTARDELASASERQGVPISRAVASSSPMLQRGAQALKDIPILGDPLTKASDQSIAKLNEAVKTAAASYGSGSVEAAGQAGTQAMKDWITGPVDEATDLRTGSAAVNQRLYGQVDRLATDYAKKPTNLSAAVDQELSKRQGMGLMGTATAENDYIAQAKTMGLSPQAIEQIKNQIPAAAADTARLTGSPGPTTQMIMGAVNKPGGMTYQGLKDLRTKVGQMMSGQIAPEAGTDQPLLKSYYGALTKDMRDTLQRGSGQDAVNAFDKANRVAAKISDRREALSSIIGAKGDAAPAEVLGRIEQLAGSRSTADIQTLVKARKAVGPEVWDEMSSAIINRMGRDAEGNFSGDRFLTAYGSKEQETTKGLSPAGKNVLFRSTGETERAQALDDIATLSSAAKNMSRFASTSRSGSPTALLGIGALLMHNPIQGMAAILGGNVTARILASPISVKPAAQWSKAYVAASNSQTSENMQRLASAARVLALTTAKDLGLDFQKTYQSLGGTIPANAQNQ